MSPKRIIIVEDDLPFGIMLKGWLEKNSFEAVLVSNVEQAKSEIIKEKFSMVLSDLRLPDGDGIMLLSWISDSKIKLPVIIMTSYGEVQSAVSAIKLGAEDFLEKPINPSILKEKLEAVFAKDISQDEKPVSISKGKEKLPEMVFGRSSSAKKMFSEIELVAPTKMTVLILGESGTGKEYIAGLIHETSSRKGKPFIAVDCGSLSKELAPSELFGHLKGSFTSSVSDKKGVFEQAEGGTVFLDEIGNLPYEVQVQLLRTLQEQKVRPVGSAKDIKIDVRIIAATNEDLDIAIDEGRFREDLYHRLDEFIIQVPPLRDRREDIGIFARFFTDEANKELGKNVLTISRSAMSILENYSWSGNLRELRNVIRRSVLFATSSEITVDNLPALNPHSKKNEDLALRPNNEKEQIEAALIKTNGNKVLAAQLLKIDRKTLYNKMHLYGMKL